MKKPKTRCVTVNIKLKKKHFQLSHCRRLCKATEIFVTIENVFFYLIYIYIYIYIYISAFKIMAGQQSLTVATAFVNAEKLH